MRQVEENDVDDVDMVVIDADVDVVERKRRDADAGHHLPYLYNTYAPAYPHYYVYPTVQKVAEAVNEEGEMSMKEEDEMVEEMQVEGVKYYTPAYQYYPGFPSVVYPFQQVAPVKAVSNVQHVQVRYPLYPGYPALTFNPTNQINQITLGQPVADAEQPGSRILPEQIQDGEEEPAALLL